MRQNRSRGIGLAFATAIISGFSIYINSYGVKAKAFGNATAYTTAKNLVAALVLVAVATVTKRRSSNGSGRPRGSQWLGLAALGVLGGGVAFILFFEGLARASTVHAAFIQKSLVVPVAILAVVFLRERISIAHLAAIGLLIAGLANLDGGLSGFRLGSGEAMIGAATILWSLEVIIAKRLLGSVSSVTLGVARMTVGVLVLVSWSIATGAATNLLRAGPTDWGWAIATGLILAAYVTTWLAALANAQALDVTAVLVLGAVITALLQAGTQNLALSPRLPGLVLIGTGAAVAAWLGARPARRTGAPL